MTDDDLVEASCAVPVEKEEHREVQPEGQHANNGDRLCTCGESFKSLLGPEGLTAHIETSRA